MKAGNKWLSVIALLFTGIVCPQAVVADDTYPNKPIRLIVPWVPGGFTDIFARNVAEQMSRRLGQQIVVENKPGANGSIGTDFVARSPGDGYTIIMETADTHAINPSIYKDLKYDPVKDFKQISILSSQPLVFAVAAHVKANTVAEFVALAKQQPGQLSYGTWGLGSVSHLAIERFSGEAGIKLNHVPYKGVSPAIVDVAAGRVDAMFVGFLSVGDNFKNGKIRPLAMTSAKRASLLPDVQTLQELGYKDFDVNLWYGLGVPASTPDSVVETLSAAAQYAVQKTDIHTMLESYAMEARGTNAVDANKFVVAEREKWKQAAAIANIEAQ
ncbi:MAG: tripartite tricarboxylate transporter substrate binding protein [Burkholderiales bacterium]